MTDLQIVILTCCLCGGIFYVAFVVFWWGALRLAKLSDERNSGRLE